MTSGEENKQRRIVRQVLGSGRFSFVFTDRSVSRHGKLGDFRLEGFCIFRVMFSVYIDLTFFPRLLYLPVKYLSFRFSGNPLFCELD